MEEYSNKYGIINIYNDFISNGKYRNYRCKCHCGKEFYIQKYLIKNGNTKSCGCKKYGNYLKHGMSGNKINKIFRGINERCNNKNYNKFHRYGGRGIKCEWNSFEEFYKDMGEGYKEGLSIDRINNDGNYCKENCRWVTPKEQANNRSTNININLNGVTKTLKQWCEELGLKYKYIHSMKNKINLEEYLNNIIN